MKVLILMGSSSDRPVMKEAETIFTKFNIPVQVTVASAHRSPAFVLETIRNAEEGGVQVPQSSTVS